MESSSHFVQTEKLLLLLLALIQHVVSLLNILISLLDLFLHFVQIVSMLHDHLVDVLDDLLVVLHSLENLIQLLLGHF